MGGQSVAGIYHITCRYPCRLCTVCKDNIHMLPDAAKASLRDSEEAKNLLAGSFCVYCKKERRLPITDQEKSKLRKLKRRKLHPVENALFLFDLPDESLTGYLLTPADCLHTLLSGLFRDWIVYTVVISNYYNYIIITYTYM